MSMSTSDSDQLDPFARAECDQFSCHFQRGDGGSTWHAMPALLDGVGNAHAFILTGVVLRWHPCRVSGLGVGSS